MPIDATKLRKLLHRKSPEMLAPLLAGNTAAGGFFVSDKYDVIPGHDSAFFFAGVSSIWRYNSDEDSWMQVPNSGLGGTFGAGSCGEFHPLSHPGGVQNLTALAGGTTTVLNTGLNLPNNLIGYRLQVVAGAGVGYSGTIQNNTLGANAAITVTPAAAVAFDATTIYRIYGGSVFFLNAGAAAFGVYDLITNTWTVRSATGIPAWGTEAQLCATAGAFSSNGSGFVNGTSTGSNTSTTLNATNKTWPVNGWTNSQVRITTGTGRGQIREIVSNTATALTVATAWTVTPDNTSVYVIEGNDDELYLSGNNAVTLYRYNISTNSWATLTPAVARAAAFAAGGTKDWVESVPAWMEGQNGVYAAHAVGMIRQNGRYLYSFRGGATNVLDVYDIAANTWINNVVYGNQMETFTGGSHTVDRDGIIYIAKEATGRIYKFDVAKNRIDPYYVSPMPQGAAVVGDKMMIQTLVDGGEINWLYLLAHTRAEMTRILMI